MSAAGPVKTKLTAAKNTLVRVLSKVAGKPMIINDDATSCPAALRSILSNAPKDVPKFDLDGQSLYARLINVHDGDSQNLLILFANRVYKVHTRLIGLDTPEIRTKDLEEKKLAIRARNRVCEWAFPSLFQTDGDYTEKQITEILLKNPCIIFMRCEEDEKFGRVLVRLFKSDTDTESINDILVKEGYADVYMGDKKTRSWDH